MPGDYSRKIFDKKKHYSGVLMQQGRVQLDADWNEEVDILQYRTFTETKDVIGACGVPKKNGGFEIISTPENFLITPGRIYVDGLLCELEELSPLTTYLNQPYYPNPDLSYFIQDSPPDNPESPESPPSVDVLSDGTYLVYLEAWQREINFRDDALIQEKALGEADTTTRLQTVWQVKLLKVADNVSPSCKTNFEEWDALVKPATGKLTAQTISNTDPKEPCILPPSAGYRRLENQLYRVEVQTGGDRSVARFKWSRDNATVETKITGISGSVLAVSDLGKDEVLGFSPGQWVEIVDEESSLKNMPHALLEIDSVKPELNKITLKTNSPVVYKAGLKLRRWDQSGATALSSGVAMPSGWIDIEDGIQVEFSDGNYRSGDHWLIPARTATGEIEWPPFEVPNLNPDPQSPLGINRHYCKLALIQAEGGSTLVEDCRHLFPSLTDICAEDICFNNDTCDFAGAETVQDALDRLCAANDLRKHNKLLHGYGVICGLKVICGKPDGQTDGRGKVFIEPGNALDCDGNFIEVKKGGIRYEIVAEAEANGLLTEGTGTVCLKIAGTGNKASMISIEKFEKQDFWDEILEGTLLKDFYTGCIEKYILFLKEQFSFKLNDDAPVSIEQRRLTAIINLLAQFLNSKSGPYGFISGIKKKHLRSADCGDGTTEAKYEDDLLYCLYEKIKDLLASETYCAMFDFDKFPDYDLDPGLETIFGPPIKFHDKLKLDPTGQYAYTCGRNNKVYVYDLKKQDMIQSTAFPASAQIKIQDVVISKENIIYAVGLLDEKDSEFAIGKITDGKIKWTGTSVHCAKRYVSLALSPEGNLYTIAKGEGLFEISGIAQANFAQVLKQPANATGMLAFSPEANVALYAEAPAGVLNPSSFTQVSGFNLSSGSKTTFFIGGADPGNDIIFYKEKVYISGTAVGAPIRMITEFNMGGAALRTIQVEPSSFIHLAVDIQRNLLLISLSDMLKVVCAELSKGTVKKDFRIPVQTYPMSIVVSPANGRAYVLNLLVNTITDIDMAKVFNAGKPPNFTYEPPEKLRIYRKEVIKAYKRLFTHLLQSLKDCFCDKFLVDCPVCNENNKVYLGCVEIRDRKVYHICNFTKRQYVKTFPTVEYWLSTVPVLPMFKKAFTTFCCSVIDKGSGGKL
ncbi:MAG: DUF6519 domain-containing protein [Ginsengibacter sp.]